MDTEQYDVGFYGLMEHMDTREILAATVLALALTAGAHEHGTLHLAAAAVAGFAAASRIPKPWAPLLGSAAASGCAAFLAGAPIAYGLGYGAALGLLIWCVVRLSGDAAKNLK